MAQPFWREKRINKEAPKPTSSDDWLAEEGLFANGFAIETDVRTDWCTHRCDTRTDSCALLWTEQLWQLQQRATKKQS